MSEPKYGRMICEDCGSEDVKLDAIATWNRDIGRWELFKIFYETEYCGDCGSPTNIIFKE